jgi:hypothetical protein
MLARTVTNEIADSQPDPSPCCCEERYHLLDEFLDAVHELNHFQTQQTQAVISGDRDFSRFDALIYLAQERKDTAKYAWMAHVETHHCEEDLWP